MIEKKRLHFVDIAKGILILFLPLVHFNSANSLLDFDMPYKWIIMSWQILFTPFRMAGFLILSGYVSNFSKSNKEFLNSLLRYYIIPLIFFQIVVYIGMYFNDPDLHYFEKHCFYPPYTTLWFIWAVLIGRLVCFVFKKYSSNDNCLLFFTFMLLVVGVLLNYYEVGVNVLAYKNALVACFFVAFGHMLRKRPVFFEKAMKFSLFIYPTIILLLLLFRFSIPTFTILINVSPKSLIVFVILATTGTLSLLKISTWIKLNRLLEYIGRNTLTIYSLHFIPLFFYVRSFWLLLEPKNIFSFIGYLFLVYMLEYSTCLGLTWVFNKYPLSFFVGKRVK